MESLSIHESLDIIAQQQLKPVSKLWHYSYNIEHYYNQMIFDEHEGFIYLYSPKHLNQWSPPVIFTNNDMIAMDDKHTSSRPYWFCRLTSFDDYLERRSGLSKHPRKHFPTRQTFHKKHEVLQGDLKTEPLDEAKFIGMYDQLRRPEHMSGAEILAIMHRANRKTPGDWFKMISLMVDGQGVGVGLVVDDGRSQSLVNLASLIDGNRYGLYMLTLWIKQCCEAGRQSIDAGVSGTYGTYKDQIFLDSGVVHDDPWVK